MRIMRRLLLLAFLCIAFPYLGYSQFGNESHIPYFRYSVTAGIGPTLLYGDLEERQVGVAGYLRGNYFLTHGISVGLELQEGLLRGEGDEGKRATNLFHAALLGVNFQPFKFLQDDHLRRIEYRESYGKRTLNSVYVGAGVGGLYSLQWDRRTAASGPSNGEGRTRGLSYLISTNIGVELPLHSLKPDLLDSYIWNLVVNGQLNFSLDDELDGYNESLAVNKHRDIYGLLSIGVNLRF